MDSRSYRLPRTDDVLDNALQQSTAQAAEKVLKQHPYLAPRLQTLVSVARAMQELGNTKMPQEARTRVQAQLRRAVLQQRRQRASRIVVGRFAPPVMRMAAWAAVLIALLGAGVTGLTFAARLWNDQPPTFATTVAQAEREVAAIAALARQAQPIPAGAAVDLRRTYAAALALGTAEPPGSRPARLSQLQQRGAEDAALLRQLAAEAPDDQRSALAECAEAAQWLADAAGSAQESSPAP
jgi:hypothetical protein